LKKILPLIILLVLGALAAVPHFTMANEQGQETGDHDSDTNNSHGLKFHARLTGAAQVGPVQTDAFGFAEVRLIDNTTLQFKVTVCNIANVTASHIHVGNSTTNGDIVIHFFDEPTFPVSSTHGCITLEAGFRTPSDLHTSSKGGINSWNDFVKALESGNTYVNVHTTQHPFGEIRGQLVSEHSEDENEDD
jgi:hypothetical protein